MKYPLVYVIVLNWNGREHLQSCFSSLIKLNYPNARLVMVDNGSRDESVPYVRQNFPTVHVIQLKKNIGFAAGNNAGMKHALSMGAHYVYLLNNDIEVHPDCIDELVKIAEQDRSIAVCASKMLYFYNRYFINGMGTCLTKLAMGWDQYDGRLNDDQFSVPQEVIAACGGAFFIRTDALRKTGLFDPHYFIYMEDTDHCIRLRQKGYRIVTVPTAIVYHKFSATMKEGSPWKYHLLLRNRLYFITKLYPWRAIIKFLPTVIKRELDTAHSFYRQGKEQYSRAVYSALVKYLALLPHALAYRMRSGSPFTPKTWQMLWPQESMPPVKKVHLPPQRLDRQTLPDSIVMGTADGGLGTGWYALDKDDKVHYRWMARRAHAYLTNPRGESKRLLIHVRNPLRYLGGATLQVLCNGNAVGTCEPQAEWDSYYFTGKLPQGISEITLLSDKVYKAETTGLPGDYSFCVKEITVMNE